MLTLAFSNFDGAIILPFVTPSDLALVRGLEIMARPGIVPGQGNVGILRGSTSV